MTYQVLSQDEMGMEKVRSDITVEELLQKRGVFFLKDLLRILDLRVSDIRRHAQELEEQGDDPYEVMGVRKMWNHRIVRMAIFAPYYTAHFQPRWRKVSEDWNANRLFQERGVFRLADIVKLIPMTAGQVRHRARSHSDAKTILGVWKDDRTGVYLVDIQVFRAWFVEVWDGS